MKHDAMTLAMRAIEIASKTEKQLQRLLKRKGTSDLTKAAARKVLAVRRRLRAQ